MTPIFFTIGNQLRLKIIPDTQLHMDGHPVLTYNYNIFLDSSKDEPSRTFEPGTITKTDNMDNPDYYGYITIEKPGQLFTYTPGEKRELTRTEVEEVIEQISHYRDNPRLWKYIDN